MNINQLTIGNIKEISKLLNVDNASMSRYKFQKGQKVCIRSVTMTYTGVIEEDFYDFVVLSSVAWIADSGRWSDFLKDPSLVEEAEKYPEGSKVTISKGTIVEVCGINDIVRETI